MDGPVMMTVRLEASMPAVTCSAVEADPNPLGPGSPVTSLKSPILPAPPQQGDETERKVVEEKVNESREAGRYL